MNPLSSGKIRVNFMGVTKYRPEVGQEFNRLTVITEPFIEGKFRYVGARCKCGNELARVNIAALYTGKTKSCGCLRTEIHKLRPRKIKYNPQVGDIYEKLTVSSEVFSENGIRYIFVDCKCGTVALKIRVTHFCRGSYKSCGCGKIEAAKRNLPKPMPGRTNPAYKVGGKMDKEIWIYQQKCNPCLDCNIQYPWYVMQFDHVPERGPKLCMINHHDYWKYSIEEMQAERLKCDLLCSNCHDRRTVLRARGLPVTLPPWRQEEGSAYLDDSLPARWSPYLKAELDSS